MVNPNHSREGFCHFPVVFLILLVGCYYVRECRLALVPLTSETYLNF